MNYKELVAKGEKAQINSRNEKKGSLCPDKDALDAYYKESVETEEEGKDERIANTIKAYVAKRKLEKGFDDLDAAITTGEDK